VENHQGAGGKTEGRGEKKPATWGGWQTKITGVALKQGKSWSHQKKLTGVTGKGKVRDKNHFQEGGGLSVRKGKEEGQPKIQNGETGSNFPIKWVGF